MTFPNGIGLDLDFMTGTMPGGVTFARTSGATYFDSSGTMQTAPSGTPRFDYDPVTLAPKGLLLEEGRNNSIRNSTNVGAAAGTPGTLPTNWIKSSATGLAWNVVGTGTESGIPYIDLLLSGTSSALNVNNIFFEAGAIISVSAAQVWAANAYVKLQAGSLANITQISLNTTQAPGGSQFATLFTPTGAALAAQRVNVSATIAASQTSMQPFLKIVTATAPVAVDATFRIGGVQCELGTFPTAFIPTSTVSVARAADSVSLPLGAWFNASAGTMYSEASWNGVSLPNCFSRPLMIDDGTQNNAMFHAVGVVGATNNITSSAVAAGVANQWGQSSLSFVLGTIFRQMTSFAANDIWAALNGVQLGSHDVAATIPSGLTTMRFGNGASGVGPVSAHSVNIRRIRHWPTVTALADLLVGTQAVPAVAIAARGRGVGRGGGVIDRGATARGRGVSRGSAVASLGTKNGPQIALIV